MIVGSKKSRFLAPLTALIFLASSVAAQGFSTGYGSGSGQQLVRMANEWIFYTFEASSVADIVIFFIAPLFGYYMINKNIFSYGLESFENRLDRDAWKNTDEDLPQGLKGAALATSFITVQILGMFSSIFLLITGGMAAIAWFMSQLGLIGDWSSRGDGGGESGSSEPSEEVMDRIESLENEVSEGEDAEENLEAAESEGNVESAEHSMEHALSVFEGAEEDLEKILEFDEHELLKTIDDARNAASDSDIEKGKLSSLNDRIKDVQERVKALFIAYEQDSDSSSPSSTTSLSGSNFEAVWNNKDMDELLDLVSAIQGHVKNIRKLDLKSNTEVRDELDELIQETRRLNRVSKFLDRLDSDLGRLKNDEEKLEEMVEMAAQKGIVNQSLADKVTRNRRQIQALGSNFENLEEEIDRILPTLKKLIENLENHVVIHELTLEKMVHGDGHGDQPGIRKIRNNIEKLVGKCDAHYDNFNTSSYRDELLAAREMLDEPRVDLEDMLDSIEDDQDSYASNKLEQLKQEYRDLAG